VTQRDFITIILKEILSVEKSLKICIMEHHNELLYRRDECCLILRDGLNNDREAMKIAASILGDLRAGEIDQEIQNIMGVTDVGRNN